MDSYVTGTAIRQLREAKHLTQAELAEKLAVSAKAISKWETARGLPDISLLEPLAAALGVSVLELMQGTRRQSEPLRQPASLQALRLPPVRQCAPRHRAGCRELLRHHPAAAGHL